MHKRSMLKRVMLDLARDEATPVAVVLLTLVCGASLGVLSAMFI
jgi:hypothetical protein